MAPINPKANQGMQNPVCAPLGSSPSRLHHQSSSVLLILTKRQKAKSRLAAVGLIAVAVRG